MKLIATWKLSRYIGCAIGRRQETHREKVSLENNRKRVRQNRRPKKRAHRSGKRMQRRLPMLRKCVPGGQGYQTLSVRSTARRRGYVLRNHRIKKSVLENRLRK